MQPPFNIHHLELFYYVAKAGGITASLKIIPYGIQQPAVSLQMSQLEESVGTRLFQRKPFALTPTGRTIYEFIAPFFAGLPSLAANVQGATEQHLRLAATSNVMRLHIPGLLRKLERKVRGLRVTLRDAALVDASRLLREHEVDLALAILDESTAGNLRREPLLTLPLLLLAPSNSTYKNAAAILRAAQAGDIPLVAPPSTDLITRHFYGELKKLGHAWEVRIEAPGLDLVEAYVQEGFGIGLSVAIPGHAVSPRVLCHPLKGFPKLTYCAFWSERLSPVAQTCLAQMKEIAAGL
jgi:DNA-binding transcriptional LysR family regulator